MGRYILSTDEIPQKTSDNTRLSALAARLLDMIEHVMDDYDRHHANGTVATRVAQLSKIVPLLEKLAKMVPDEPIAQGQAEPIHYDIIWKYLNKKQNG